MVPVSLHYYHVGLVSGLSLVSGPLGVAHYGSGVVRGYRVVLGSSQAGQGLEQGLGQGQVTGCSSWRNPADPWTVAAATEDPRIQRRPCIQEVDRQGEGVNLG